MHNSHIHGTAVLAVVPVITKHKILIHTQRNRLCSNSGFFHHFISVMFFQLFPVNIDRTVQDLYRLAGR